jgi:hypothetical protein
VKARLRASPLVAWTALLLAAFTGPAQADAALDQMMRGMNNNSSPAPTPSPSSRGIPLAVPQYVQNAWQVIASRTAAINAQMRQEYSLLDRVETDLETTWDQAAAQVTEVVDKWPFPHAYWAPGIVGDATEVIMGPQGAGSITSPPGDDDPMPAPSPTPTNEPSPISTDQ